MLFMVGFRVGGHTSGISGIHGAGVSTPLLLELRYQCVISGTYNTRLGLILLLL